jgi:hypothetical protein
MLLLRDKHEAFSMPGPPNVGIRRALRLLICEAGGKGGGDMAGKQSRVAN